MVRVACLVVVLGVVLGSASAYADDEADFYGYRIPDHHSHRFSVLGQANGAAASDVGFLSTDHTGGLNGSLRSSLSWFRDSEAHQWEIDANTELVGSRSSSRSFSGAFPLMAVTDVRKESNRQAADRWLLRASTRQYPWQSVFGFELGALASLQDSHLWDHQEELQTSGSGSAPDRFQTLNALTRRFNREDVVGAFTTGWGRVRDVGTVYQVWLIEQRWRRDGTLTRPLSAATRMRLAQLFALEGEYAAAHDNPEKAFWREVERVVEEDGALAGTGLNAYATLHARDPLAPAGAAGTQRTVGWFMGPTIEGQHTHLLQREGRTLTTIQTFGDTSQIR